MRTYLLAIDQGTTGTTALIVDASGRTLGRASAEFAQHFPRPGWVEHEPEEIWTSVSQSVKEALFSASVTWEQIAAIGITNQRETTLLWERKTGRPLHRAIVWQDRRTSERCAELKRQGFEDQVRQITGLVLDPYFSGTKLEWMLDNLPSARARADAGELAFGTIDSFLVWRLSGGGERELALKSSVTPRHIIEVTNASRTLLLDLKTLTWSPHMNAMLRIPARVLPEIVPSAARIAVTGAQEGIPAGIPITGIAGDQQAALFGQACFQIGDAKCTYGTGAFVLVNTGATPVSSRHGLLSTVAWQIGAETVYALEGSAFIAGAAVQWLRDGLGVIRRAEDIEALAEKVISSDGVSFVPALSGLGAPHWDPAARGLICGITRGTTAAHLARATLEAIALQVDDLLRAMSEDLGKPLGKMRVDGGAAANNLLAQLQGDISRLTIERPEELESTARGAAMLAGVGVGLFEHKEQARQLARVSRVFHPSEGTDLGRTLRAQWEDALARTRSRPSSV